MMFLYIDWVFANYCNCSCANKAFVFLLKILQSFNKNNVEYNIINLEDFYNHFKIVYANKHDLDSELFYVPRYPLFKFCFITRYLYTPQRLNDVYSKVKKKFKDFVVETPPLAYHISIQG